MRGRWREREFEGGGRGRDMEREGKEGGRGGRVERGRWRELEGKMGNGEGEGFFCLQ